MRHRDERSLWVASMMLAWCAVAGFRAGLPEPPGATSAEVATAPGRETAPESLGTWVLRAVDQDPFRLTRRPSRRPFVLGAPADAPPPAPLILPALRLSGIVGPPWRAVVDGASPETGRVVAPGDSIAGAYVRSVGRSSVTLRLGDTSWTLSLDRP